MEPEAIVRDQTDIRLINAHAESNRGRDDRRFIFNKPVLDVMPFFRVKPGMIRFRFEPSGTQIVRQFLGIFARKTIDDG